ncbi:MAG: two-component system LytT family response regulator, partial [Parvicella sp.]
MVDKLKAVIVDDEPHALILFRKIIDWFENDIEIVGEASNLPSAITIISEKKPDVVFMDIEMPNYSGLQINDFFASPRNF